MHDIDTWQDPAKFDPDRKSALEIAVRNKDIDMIQHPIMDLILRVKWELYGRKMFISDLIKYLFLMVNTALVVSLLPYNIEERIYYTDAYGKFRIVLESITAISLLDIIIGEIGEVQTRGFRGYSNGFGRYENLTQWIYVLLKLLCVISRFGLRNADLESIFLGMASITGCMFLLFFAKGIPKLGPMVLIYYQMMTGDLIIWLT